MVSEDPYAKHVSVSGARLDSGNAMVCLLSLLLANNESVECKQRNTGGIGDYKLDHVETSHSITQEHCSQTR